MIETIIFISLFFFIVSVGLLACHRMAKKQCCIKPKLKDYSVGYKRHYYCCNCTQHIVEGKVYSQKEWNKEIDYDEESSYE